MMEALSKQTTGSCTRLVLLLLGLAFVCVLMFLFLVPVEGSARVIYVDDDATPGTGNGSLDLPFFTIPDAVNASQNGDTVRVFEGVYPGWLWIINLSIELEGNGTEKTTLLNNESFPYSIYCSRGQVAIRDLSIAVTPGGWGYAGIFLHDAHATISNISVQGHELAICTSYKNGSFMSLRDNRFESGLLSVSSDLEHWVEGWTGQDIDTSNMVDGKPLYYLWGEQDRVIPADAGQVLLESCSNITVEGLNITGAATGISVYNSSAVTIQDNSVSGSNVTLGYRPAVLLAASQRCRVINNMIFGNMGYGLQLSGARDNWVFYNHFFDNRKGGIYVNADSMNNTITGNNCSDNEVDGIYLYQATNNSIVNNVCYFNKGAGINLSRSSNNRVVENTCLWNQVAGCQLASSSDNSFLLNRFEENGDGMLLEFFSRGNEIRNNNCSRNTNNGIYLVYSFTDDILVDNRCEENSNGIRIGNSENIRIENNICSRNTEHGLYLSNSIEAEVTGNSFSGNGIGVGVYRSPAMNSRKNQLKYNSISDSTEMGMNFTGSNTSELVAVENWWGSASGPYHPELNPEGRGDEVAGNIDFQQWLPRDPLLAEEPVPVTEEKDRDSSDYLSTFFLSVMLGLGVAGLTAAAAFMFYSSEALRFRLLGSLGPLYTRLNEGSFEKDIRQHTIRGRMYQFIKDNPGVHFSSIRDELGIGSGTTVYHLQVLSRERYLRSSQAGRKKLFWVKADYPGREESTLTDIQKTILELIKKHGCLSRSELLEDTGIPRTTLGFNLRQLKERGKIQEEYRDGENYCSLL